MPTLATVRRHAIALLCFCSLGLAQATEPVPGMWSFDGELTGKPGRGFQIDSQGGSLMILTYVGYRADGTALFLQASGQRQEGEFEADLVEYRGGTVLAGPHRDGEPAVQHGRVKASFDTPATGTITLPGEAPRRVTRFQYENFAERFNNDFSVRRTPLARGGMAHRFASSQMNVRAGDGVLNIEEVMYPGTAYSRTCRYEGAYQLVGKGMRASGSMACAGEAAVAFRAEDMVVEEDGLFSAKLHLPADSADFTFLRGECIVLGRPVFADGSYNLCDIK